MAILQKTFKYEGHAASAPFKTVNLDFEIPTFEFVTVFVGGKPSVERSKVDVQSINIIQNLSDENYSLIVPEQSLIGNSESSVINFWKYLSRIGFTNDDPDLLDALSFKYNISISDDFANVFGNLTQKVLFSVASSSEEYRKLMERQEELKIASLYTEEKAQQLELDFAAYVKENIILLNKNVFKDMAAQFRALVPELNEYAFLFLVAHLTDLSSGRPVITIDAREVNGFLRQHFSIVEQQTVKAVTQLVKGNFNRLFNFPVTVPEIKPLDIKGIFQIITSDNSAVALTDFHFYNLAVEYAIETSGNESQAVSLNFDWNHIQASSLTGNTVPVSFDPVTTNLLNSLIYISVKGYDGSLLWEKEFAVTNPDLQNLEIAVPLSKPIVVTSSGRPQSGSGNKKLQGKLVEMTGKCELKGATVLVQTKKANDTIWKVVGVATTDGSGNFSMPYPYGIYTAAQALVSLTPDSPADIAILTDTQHLSLNETVADDFLYLLLEDVVCESKAGEEDCDCHEPKKSNRLPDQEQLINSDDYTQDIGGSCINLSTPNRTLNEYSHKAVVRTSDPDVANYTLVKNENGVFRLKGGHTKINRRKVNLNNVIRWQDAPDNKDNLSFYQAVTVATGHILHYKVVMKADGYSMGELLYSLPLAPGQKKQIVMFDQTHTLRGSETQRISQRENLAAALVNEIDITDTLGGSINESTRGSSSANTSGVSGGLGLAGIIQGIAATVGVAGGIANANSSASQNSSRAVAQHFQEQMRNGITQNAQSYREQNASVITTVKEGQEYGVTAEVVANHNHCHSLTMMYFEVLRHYAIYQELSQVEECLFVPLLMTEFSKENIYKWRDVLATHLLPMPAETYLQPFGDVKSGRRHPLLKAFDAIERRNTDYKHVDFPEGAYDEEIISFIKGRINLRINLARPKTKYDRIKSLPIITKTVSHEEFDLATTVKSTAVAVVTGGLSLLFGGGDTTRTVTEQILVRAEIFDRFIQLDANYDTVPPAQCIRVMNFQPLRFPSPFGGGAIPISGLDFFENGIIDKQMWEAYATILGYSGDNAVYDMLDYYFKGKLISEWDGIYYNDIVPFVFDKIVASIKIEKINTDLTSTIRYKGGEKVIPINLNGTTNLKRKNFPLNIKLFSNSPAVLSLNNLVTITIDNVILSYSTPHYNGILFRGYVGDALLDGTDLFIPENADEKRDPRKEDKYLALKLIEHLNSNLEHYNKVLWRNLDPDRRYMLLDGFGIETYDDFGQSDGFRSLASVIKNELIGISGNSLIMPVAPGYKIDRSYIVEQPIDGPAEEINLFERYKPLTPATPYRISVPSKGVFAEAVQGACDACEKVKENTSQDWDKFKTDEPTLINPVTTPVPVVTDWKAAFKDFATPIVNIQNAPAAPAPGAGLAGLSELLGKNDVFRDVTGLDANQKNAMQTYLSNQQNAKEFAQMAKDIYTMDSSNKNSDAIADSIRNSPEFSKEKKAELLEKLTNQRIDGGQSEKAAKEAAGKNNEPTAMGIASSAESKGKPVEVATSDAAGNSQSLKVGPGEHEKVLAEVLGSIPNLKQDNDNACWAFAATIMMSWKKKTTLSVNDVLKEADNNGTKYVDIYTSEQGLPSSYKEEFISNLTMVSENPEGEPSLQQFIDWVRTYGPLWLTTDSDTEDGEFSPHARILTKISGKGTPDGVGTNLELIDPATGGKQTQAFNDFMKEFQQMVSDNPSTDAFIQIVHFEENVIGEGRKKVPTEEMKNAIAKINIIQTGDGDYFYDIDKGYFTGSLLLFNFNVNDKNLKYDFHEPLIQLAKMVNEAPVGSNVVIIGRASQTGKEKWNDELSQGRAESVFNFLCSSEVGLEPTRVDEFIGVGSYFPIEDARDIELDINRSVVIRFFLKDPDPVIITPPTPVASDVGTTEWSIQIDGTAGFSAVVLGINFLSGKLKNKSTGEERSGMMLGISGGVSTPFNLKGAGNGNWYDFRTNDFYTFESFEKAFCRLTSAGGGFIVGQSVGWFGFPTMGDSVYIGGIDFLVFGASASVVGGIWMFT